MNSQVSLSEGRLRLGGVVHFENARDICEAGLALIARSDGDLVVDLSNLESGGTVDVAILLQWLKAALHSKRLIRFENISDKLRSILRVSGLSDTFPIANQ